MTTLAANLSFLFTDLAFLDRFGAAADAGFDAVEFLFPYDYAPEEIAEKLSLHRLEMALFNAPPGDWAAGDRGMAALPDRTGEFRDALDQAMIHVQALGVPRLHVMAGLTDGMDRAACRATYISNLRIAADLFRDSGVQILIEPLNVRDMPRYFLTSPDEALEIIAEVGRDNVALQLDLYHAQIMRGDLTRFMRHAIGHVGHVQIASVPDRHEPDTGELNCAHLLSELDRLGYSGRLGCEYHPRNGTLDGLGWAAAYLKKA